MKNTFFLVWFFVFGMSSCSKKDQTTLEAKEIDLPANYDTTAIDSFSQGAISVDVSERIRQSSIAYQDSLKKIKEQQKAEAELAKQKTEDEKKTKESEQKAKETTQKDEKTTPKQQESENKEPGKSAN